MSDTRLEDEKRGVIHIPVWLASIIILAFMSLAGTAYALSVDSLKESDARQQAEITTLQAHTNPIERNIFKICIRLNINCEQPPNVSN